MELHASHHKLMDLSSHQVVDFALLTRKKIGAMLIPYQDGRYFSSRNESHLNCFIWIKDIDNARVIPEIRLSDFISSSKKKRNNMSKDYELIDIHGQITLILSARKKVRTFKTIGLIFFVEIISDLLSFEISTAKPGHGDSIKIINSIIDKYTEDLATALGEIISGKLLASDNNSLKHVSRPDRPPRA
ncbi:MAG: hypothetical protein KZQ75_02095 [Candidatus Thiodiazotropha sp. (ex Myrtea spinifera)]|nr:hypothetical protein [Candidatus Thiodiazotropha sp. (ex Myrtea spinifera)]